MKLKIVLVTCFFAIVSSINAHRIVDIHRSNGFLGHYNEITQTYMGKLNGSDWYQLNCVGPGFNRCKLRYITGFVSRAEEIARAEDNLLDNLMVAVEADEIEEGVTTGETYKHYQTTLSDGSVVDIHITLTWRPDPDDNNSTLFHATITNSND